MLRTVNFLLWWSADAGILPVIMNEFSWGNVGYQMDSVGRRYPTWELLYFHYYYYFSELRSHQTIHNGLLCSLEGNEPEARSVSFYTETAISPHHVASLNRHRVLDNVGFKQPTVVQASSVSGLWLAGALTDHHSRTTHSALWLVSRWWEWCETQSTDFRAELL